MKIMDFKVFHQTFDDIIPENHKILINKNGALAVVDKACKDAKAHKLSLGTFLSALFREVQKQDKTDEDLEKAVKISSYFVKKLNHSNSLFANIKKIFQRIHNFVIGNGFRTNLQIARQIQHHLSTLNIKTIPFSTQVIAKQELQALSSEELDRNWNLNKYFGHVYVINLDDRGTSTKFKKRLECLAQDLNKIGGCTFERLRATYGAHELAKDVWSRVNDNSFNLTGEALDKVHMSQAGCFMSHYRAIKDANEHYVQAQKDLKEAQDRLSQATTTQVSQDAYERVQDAKKRMKEYSSILILEDDNGFGFVHKGEKTIPATVDLQGAGAQFRKVMKELPEDWDMFYFVAVECGKDGLQWMKAQPVTHSSHLNRVQYGLLTNAMAINSKAYPIILEALSKIDDPTKTFRSVDHEYALLHQSLKVFTPTKPLAYQAPGESSITSGEINEPWNGTWERGF